jgi:hypothetical protein
MAASEINPFHAASLPGRFGTGGHGAQPPRSSTKNAFASGGGGGSFGAAATDDAAPEFSADGSHGVAGAEEELDGGVEGAEQELSLGAAMGPAFAAQPLDEPLGGAFHSSDAAATAAQAAAEFAKYGQCSRVRCADSGFGNHPKVDLWGGVAGEGDVVCASKSAPPLDGLCLKVEQREERERERACKAVPAFAFDVDIVLGFD